MGYSVLVPTAELILLKFESAVAMNAFVSGKEPELTAPLVLRADRGPRKSNFGHVLAPHVDALVSAGRQKDSLIINGNRGYISQASLDGKVTVIGRFVGDRFQWTDAAPAGVRA